MGLFRIVEGLITIRRRNKTLPYSYFEGDYVPAVNQSFVFNKLCRDVYVQVSANTVIRFDSVSADPILVNSQGRVKFQEQWAEKMYVTFTNSPTTHMVIYANS